MHPSTPSQLGEYTWEVARLFPKQGRWSERDYLEITESSNQLVELSGGRLEFLVMPTYKHQLIVIHLLVLLREFVLKGDLGIVLTAPHPTWLGEGEYREPDVLFKLRENLPSDGDDYFRGADLVMEVVSKDEESRKRDYETKAKAYAQAGIPEYWIVDPQEQRVVVLTLEGEQYAEHANLVGEGTASSKLLTGFEADVAAIFAAGKVR